MSDRELLTECLEALTHDAAQRTFAGGVRMSQLAIKLRAHLAAPDEMEALRRENERLREALQWIASRCPTDQFVDLQPHRIHLEAAHDAGACARAALKEVPR